MAEQNILTYKGKPLVRQGRFIFYGNPDDKCILFMNILTPYIESWTKNRVFGVGGKKA